MMYCTICTSWILQKKYKQIGQNCGISLHCYTNKKPPFVIENKHIFLHLISLLFAHKIPFMRFPSRKIRRNLRPFIKGRRLNETNYSISANHHRAKQIGPSLKTMPNEVPRFRLSFHREHSEEPSVSARRPSLFKMFKLFTTDDTAGIKISRAVNPKHSNKSSGSVQNVTALDEASLANVHSNADRTVGAFL